MESSSQPEPDTASAHQGCYTLGYSSHLAQHLSKRRAGREAGFLLPHLGPGMSLLDCGCGPGSITMGLAQAVYPGQVVGTDLEESQLKLAQQHSDQQGIANVRFQVGDVYELTFPDSSFDRVFAGSVLSYLTEPLRALGEMRRVLRPGGVIGVRNIDFDGCLVWPWDQVLLQSYALFQRVSTLNGGNHRIGKSLRGLLQQAGFVRCEASASYECHGTPEATLAIAETEARRIETAPAYRQAVELGFTDGPTLDKISAAWREWGQHPDAFFARSFCEAVGWKE